jgi:hypothetical protein
VAADAHHAAAAQPGARLVGNCLVVTLPPSLLSSPANLEIGTTL